MDILNSTMSHLGWYDAESYGISYKARGCDALNLAVCDALDVLGSQRNSHFLHNYMGTYTYNARNMVFDGNEYAHNKMYGLDPHDDSDYLTITNNHAHHNGLHGIICSQRCDHLTITDKHVHDNGVPPYIAPGDEDASDNQVHGIMLHRGVTSTVVEDNDVEGHVNGAGIAVFDSVGNDIRNNRVSGNKVGLRSSVGTRDNTYSNNTVTGSLQYAVNAFPGVKDKPVYGVVPSGRPTGEVFTGNTFAGSGSNLVKLTDTDGFRFEDNAVTGTVGSVIASTSTKLLWDGAAAPGAGLTLTSSTSLASTATLRLPDVAAKVTPGGSGGKITVTDPQGRMFTTGPSGLHQGHRRGRQHRLRRAPAGFEHRHGHGHPRNPSRCCRTRRRAPGCCAHGSHQVTGVPVGSRLPAADEGGHHRHRRHRDLGRAEALHRVHGPPRRCRARQGHDHRGWRAHLDVHRDDRWRPHSR
jgi:parallel beta-helix repeat protein